MPKPSVKTILQTAIKIEEQSIKLYQMAQSKVRNPSAKRFLAELAEEERQHKEKLQDIIEDEAKIGELGSPNDTIQDLMISDTLQVSAFSEDYDYQKILIFAAKREKSTYEYYQTLAAGFHKTEMGKLFLKLAQEELKHKNRLETEYDQYILGDN